MEGSPERACNPFDVDDVYIEGGRLQRVGIMERVPLGEVEHWVLLVILRLGEGAFALDVLRELDREAGHVVARGSLYKTLERLASKGLTEWELEEGSPARGGHPRRRFSVTEAGLEALREGRRRMLHLWDGVEDLLEGET